MEELVRMVAASMARHGCDTPIDHRRLNWSPWFRCELSLDLLLVPSAPGIFTLAEEVGTLGIPQNPSDSEVGSLTSEAATSGAATSGSPTSGGTTSRAFRDVGLETLGTSENPVLSAKALTTRDNARRMLAVFEIAETEDLGAALVQLFAPGNALRDRLRTGRCFARFTPVIDGDQRQAACAALRKWLHHSPDTEATNVAQGASRDRISAA
jgi:hypothetical protein